MFDVLKHTNAYAFFKHVTPKFKSTKEHIMHTFFQHTARKESVDLARKESIPYTTDQDMVDEALGNSARYAQDELNTLVRRYFAEHGPDLFGFTDLLDYHEKLVLTCDILALLDEVAPVSRKTTPAVVNEIPVPPVSVDLDDEIPW